MNRTAYDPRTDSSPGHTGYGQDAELLARDPNADNPGFDLDSTVILEVGFGHGDFRLCGCGCQGKVANSHRAFQQGHDQRLIGILTRAAIHGAEVAVANGGGLISGDALGMATHCGLNDRGQAKLVRNVEAAKAKAAGRRPTAQPIAPAGEWVSDGETMKVGRWTYPVRRFVVEDRVTENQRNSKRDGTGEWINV